MRERAGGTGALTGQCVREGQHTCEMVGMGKRAAKGTGRDRTAATEGRCRRSTLCAEERRLGPAKGTGGNTEKKIEATHFLRRGPA